MSYKDILKALHTFLGVITQQTNITYKYKINSVCWIYLDLTNRKNVLIAS